MILILVWSYKQSIESKEYNILNLFLLNNKSQNILLFKCSHLKQIYKRD